MLGKNKKIKELKLMVSLLEIENTRLKQANIRLLEQITELLNKEGKLNQKTHFEMEE